MSDHDTRALRALSFSELLDVFRGLPCPSLDELHGEYRGGLLRQSTLLRDAGYRSLLFNPLSRWLGKGFRPLNDEIGRGYNAVHAPGRADRLKWPMITRLALSTYDGEPAYQLIYPAFPSSAGLVNMVDEVRRYAPGIYLGLGIYGVTRRQRSTPATFVLTGPIREYRRDVGTPFGGFDSVEDVRAALRRDAATPELAAPGVQAR